MKMHSTSFAVSLIVTLISYSAIAVQADNSTNPKLSGTLNKYASPQLYVFGGRNEGEVLSSASKFNSSTGEWKNITNMSMTRREHCGAVVGTKIYLFGGDDGQSSGHGYSETVEVYDCETGIYSPYRSMSSPRRNCGAAVLDGHIYVAGGVVPGVTASESVIRYNIQTTRREYVRPMHEARFGLQLVELGGRLYAIGGVNTHRVESYNVTTNRWTNVAGTHYDHVSFGAAVHEGKIYVCSNKGFEVYTPEADQWDKLKPLNDYEDRTMVSMNGQLWALGGSFFTGSHYPTSKSVHTYNTTTNQWTERANMDVAREFSTAFVVNH